MNFIGTFNDYWYFYEALESFLYGIPSPNLDDQILWGITNFSPVWEDMCIVYLHKNEWDGVWYADSMRWSNKSGIKTLFARIRE